jgi:hypothetical protein
MEALKGIVCGGHGRRLLVYDSRLSTVPSTSRARRGSHHKHLPGIRAACNICQRAGDRKPAPAVK